MSTKDALDEIYYDPGNPGGYGGLRKLYKAARGRLGEDVNYETVKDWSREQDAYTLHKGARSRFERRVTEVASEGQQLQADLMDIRAHTDFNDGYNYLLTCVDVFSRKAWAVPVRNKTGARVAEALREILNGRKYIALQTDKGKEFYNAQVKDLLKTEGVKHFSTENETIKASMVERFNRTLRDKIYRYMTAKASKRFVHILPDLVKAYNETPHSATGEKPDDVGPDNREAVNQRLYLIWRENPKEGKVNVGDCVRITKYRGAFERGYTPNWTTEIFVVSGEDRRVRPSVFSLEDLNGEVVEGAFYEQELQVVKKPDAYKIEKVIRTRRRRGGGKQFLVKWLGYPDSFNSWVDESDMV